MSRSTADILAECTGAIERGEMTPEECIAYYPESEQELAPLLKTLEALRRAQAVSPRPAYRRAARARLLGRLSDRRPLTWRDRFAYNWEALMERVPVRRSAIALGLMMVVFLALIGGRGAVYASQEALPGDSLYVVKTGVEEVRLAFSPKEDAVRLYLGFTGTRVREVERLAGVGRYEDVPAAIGRYHTQVQRASDLLSQIARQDAMRGETLGALWNEGESAYRSDLERVLQTLPEQMRLQLERGDGEELLEASDLSDAVLGDNDDDRDGSDHASDDRASSSDAQPNPPSSNEPVSEDKDEGKDSSHESAGSSSSDEDSSDHSEGDEAETGGHSDADPEPDQDEEGSSADGKVEEEPGHDDDTPTSDDEEDGEDSSHEEGSDEDTQPSSEPDDHSSGEENHDGSDDDDDGKTDPEGSSDEVTDGTPSSENDESSSNDDGSDSGDSSSDDESDSHEDDDDDPAGGDDDESDDHEDDGGDKSGDDESSSEHEGDKKPKDRSDD